ncbi:MAG: hypothetical protein KatS3mg105_4799 [Gemmatales bacterium]|nr:MAG: hypothetical protein KatS3mg105_4799 [Gemmatales bacterium]
MSHHALSLAAGQELCPGYKLIRLLGKGGYGSVWEVDANGRTVALKFLETSNDEAAIKEIRAIQAVKQLHHPNLVPIEQVWAQSGHVIVTMPLADGSVLDLYEACLEEFGTPMKPDEVLPMLAQAAAGLDFLNKRQHIIDGRRVAIQHCDIKPSNLLLFGDKVKICDFGLSTITTTTVRFHRRAGTLAYAAPEVFQGRLSDHTDQYALAVSYCQLVSGKFPFHDTPSKFTEDYVRPAPDLSMLAEAERPIIARALSPVPQQRYPTCQELINELKRANGL